MSTVSRLRKNKINVQRLADELEKTSGAKKSYIDERFWKPTTDKGGNGFATIRFLPTLSEDDPVAWRRMFSHGFQGPGGWYLENCPTTLGDTCPLCQENTKLWDTGDNSKRNIARDRKRVLKYISYIYVVDDPSVPDNDGKVFLYKYGKKIYEKLNNLMIPEFPDEIPRNPFDIDDGCNFKLKIRKVDGYINYDKSEFAEPSILSTDDDFLDTILDQVKSLDEFTSKDNFKSYDDLKSRLTKVLGVEDRVEIEPTPTYETVDDTPAMVSESVSEPADAPKPTKSKESRGESTSESDISYFEKLANTDW